VILPFSADEVAQGVDVLVVDLGHTGDREAAETLAAEQQRLLVALGLAVFENLPLPRGGGISHL
jgi:hypothetical protein